MITCPKCNRELPQEEITDCPFCGVVFSKLTATAGEKKPLTVRFKSAPNGKAVEVGKEPEKKQFRRIFVEDTGGRRSSPFSVFLLLLCVALLTGIVAARYYPPSHPFLRKIPVAGELFLSLAPEPEKKTQAPGAWKVVQPLPPSQRLTEFRPEEEIAKIFEQQPVEKSPPPPSQTQIVSALDERLKNGFQFLRDKKYYDALSEFDGVLSAYPGNPVALKGKGYSEIALGRDIAGISNIERSLENREDEGVLFYLARHYYEASELDKAEDRLRRYLKLRPGNAGAAMFLEKIRKEKSVSGGFQRKIANHFDVWFDGKENTSIGNDAVSSLEDAYLYLSRELGFRPDEKVQATIYTDKDFHRAYEGFESAAGLFDGKIRLPVRGLKNRDAYFDEVVIHETVHAFMFLMGAAARCPRWFNEGLSELFSTKGRKNDYVAFYEKKVKQGAIKPFDISSLSGACMSGDAKTMGFGYLQSASIALFISSKYGMYDVKRMLKLLSGGEDFFKIMKQILKEDEGSLLEKWKASL